MSGTRPGIWEDWNELGNVSHESVMIGGDWRSDYRYESPVQGGRAHESLMSPLGQRSCEFERSRSAYVGLGELSPVIGGAGDSGYDNGHRHSTVQSPGAPDWQVVDTHARLTPENLNSWWTPQVFVADHGLGAESR